MSLETIIASPNKDFSTVVTLTDSFVPACNVWIGDYPYVNKEKFKQFVKKVSSTNGKKNNKSSESSVNNFQYLNINNKKNLQENL
jgi:hypothetical protein